MRRTTGILMVATAWATCVSTAFAPPEEEYRDEMVPILKKNCYECHGEEKQKGDLNLASFTEYAQINETRETWQKVLEMVQAFEMPPKGKKEM
ncbi:MAG TPA: c-type cytochrome domain-containing protein, partial [Verrucomicrobiae bacterium]|nr:c-type cytochrome domain-containing protein [Verrucomicrobiae bacterium]